MGRDASGHDRSRDGSLASRPRKGFSYRPVIDETAELPTAVAEIWLPVVCKLLAPTVPFAVVTPKLTVVVVAVIAPEFT